MYNRTSNNIFTPRYWNARWSKPDMIPIVKHVSEGKSVFIQIQNNPTKQMLLRKNISLFYRINCIQVMHKTCQIISAFTNQCDGLQMSQPVPSSSSHSPLTFPSSSLSFHNIIIITHIHCIGYTALFKTLCNRVWWDALPCFDDWCLYFCGLGQSMAPPNSCWLYSYLRWSFNSLFTTIS